MFRILQYIIYWLSEQFLLTRRVPIAGNPAGGSWLPLSDIVFEVAYTGTREASIRAGFGSAYVINTDHCATTQIKSWKARLVCHGRG